LFSVYIKFVFLSQYGILDKKDKITKIELSNVKKQKTKKQNISNYDTHLSKK